MSEEIFTKEQIKKIKEIVVSKHGVRLEFIKRMMGHKIDVEGTSYEGTFDDPDEFALEYVENIEQYTLLGNGKKLGIVDKRVEKLEEQNKQLIEHIGDLKQISKILIEMKREEDRIEEAKGIKFGKGYKTSMEVLEDRVNKLYKKEIDKGE